MTKALYQYFRSQNVTREQLLNICEAKIRDAVEAKVGELIRTERFQQLLIDGVVQVMRKEKAAFDRDGGYGFHNRLRDLAESMLQKQLLSDYTVSITPKVK